LQRIAGAFICVAGIIQFEKLNGFFWHKSKFRSFDEWFSSQYYQYKLKLQNFYSCFKDQAKKSLMVCGRGKLAFHPQKNGAAHYFWYLIGNTVGVL
jgi:hypothetical protein